MRDHATRARQTIIVRPQKPRAAPTTMKTVPSGSEECLMNGAFCVGGTVGSGYWPARVGRSFGRPDADEPPVIVRSPVMVGTEAVVVAELVVDPVGVIVMEGLVLVEEEVDSVEELELDEESAFGSDDEPVVVLAVAGEGEGEGEGEEEGDPVDEGWIDDAADVEG